MARLLCAIRGIHADLARHPLGGWRCRLCGAPLADFDEAGYPQGGFVPVLRRVFSRERHELTRTEHYEPTRRGF